MANSGWFGTTNEYIDYQIRVLLTGQSIANNTSNVTVEVWVKRTNTGYTTYGTGTVTCGINNVTYTSAIDTGDKITSTAIKLFSKSLTIPHNSDGTKLLAISAKINHSKFDSSLNNYNETLATIPRASTISSLTSNVIANGINTSSVEITRASSTFTHTVKWTCGVYNYTITGVATSTSYVIPATWLNALPNATSGQVIVTLYTYSGSTLIGTTSKSFTITVPSEVVPTIGALNRTRVDNGVPSEWGVYVQGKSKATVTATGAAGAYGSTITSYAISGGGYAGTTSSLTTGVLAAQGTNTFTVVVKDSRGRTASKTETISVVAYSNPKLSTITAARCLSNGTLSDDGTYLKVTATDEVSSVAGKNVITRSVKYRRVGTTTWSTAVAYTSGIPIVIGDGAINTEYSYEVNVSVADTFGTASASTSVSTAFTTMDFLAGGKGMAIGKVAEAEILDVAMPTTHRSSVVLNGGVQHNGLVAYNVAAACPFPVGSIHMSISPDNPSTIFGGTTWSAWGTGRVPIGVGTYNDGTESKTFAAETSGGKYNHTLTVDQMPSHNHTQGTHYHSTFAANNIEYNADVFAVGTANGLRWSASPQGALNTSTGSAGAISYAGGNIAHNNIQPYITCYMWVRTA